MHKNKVIDNHFSPGQGNLITQNIFAIQQALEARCIQYFFSIAHSLTYPSTLCRRYTLATKDRSNDRTRLEFIQIFSFSRRYNKGIPNYRFSMSVVPDPSAPHNCNNNSYPIGIGGTNQEDGDAHAERYSSVPPIHGPVSYGMDDDPTLMPAAASPSSGGLDSPAFPLSPDSLSNSAHVPPTKNKNKGRAKKSGKGSEFIVCGDLVIKKPYRAPPTQAPDGQYHCTWDICTDTTKVFKRPSEWQ